MNMFLSLLCRKDGLLRVSLCVGLLLAFGVVGIAANEANGAPATVPGPAGEAAVGFDAGEPVDLQADHLEYDSKADAYEARGSVVLRQGGLSLMAEQVVWQPATQDVSAEGGVLLEEALGSTQASRIHYNLATGTGRIRDGRIFLSQQNFHLAGSEIEKLDEATYRVTDGKFTTCDGVAPDWSFTAEDVNVRLGRYAEARHVWFRVRDIPLLYTPYIAFPIKSERESGFLLPRFGYSEKRGVQVSTAWYQVIDRHLDATLYLDYMSDLGVGKGAEFRYLLGQNNRGEALYYHVSGISRLPDMYAVDWEHGGTLPGAIRLSADIQYVDDERFFSEFGEGPGEYNRDKTVSTIWAQRNWDRLNLVAKGRYIKDLEEDDDTLLQTLPELNLSLSRYRLWQSPLYLGLTTLATNFSSDEGDDGRRLYLKPSVAAVFRPGTWLEVIPEIALYHRRYDVETPDERSTLPEYSTTLATRLQRVFTFDRWGIEKVMHSIEPKVVYRYRPYEEQAGLPEFDFNDRITEANRIEYQLINRLTMKGVDDGRGDIYRELAHLRLSQVYDIGVERDDAVADPEPFSDLRVELSLQPTAQLYLDFDQSIAVHDTLEFTRFVAATGYDDDHGNRVELNYHYRDDAETANLALTDLATTDQVVSGQVDYLGFELDTAMFKPVYLHFEERYDFVDSRELERVIGVEYRSRCWSLFLVYRDRLDDQEFLVTFNLSGLDGVARSGMDLARSDRFASQR